MEVLHQVVQDDDLVLQLVAPRVGQHAEHVRTGAQAGVVEGAPALLIRVARRRVAGLVLEILVIVLVVVAEVERPAALAEVPRVRAPDLAGPELVLRPCLIELPAADALLDPAQDPAQDPVQPLIDRGAPVHGVRDVPLLAPARLRLDPPEQTPGEVDVAVVVAVLELPPEGMRSRARLRSARLVLDPLDELLPDRRPVAVEPRRQIVVGRDHEIDLREHLIGPRLDLSRVVPVDGPVAATHLEEALDAARAGAGRRRVEQVDGGPPRDDALGDRVRVALVAVAGPADAAREMHALALLHEVRRLVGGGAQARGPREGDGAIGDVAARAERPVGGARRLAHVGARRRDVVGAEGELDRPEVGQRARRPGEARPRDRLDPGRAEPARVAAVELDRGGDREGGGPRLDRPPRREDRRQPKWRALPGWHGSLGRVGLRPRGRLRPAHSQIAAVPHRRLGGPARALLRAPACPHSHPHGPLLSRKVQKW